MSFKILPLGRRILILAFVLIIFYFLIRSIVTNWQKIDFSLIRFSFKVLALSLSFLIASSLFGIFSWLKNLSVLGKKISYPAALRTVAISQMGKYIPGKVWSVGGRIVLAKGYGVPEVLTAAGLLIETIALSLSAFVLFLVALPFFGQSLPQKFFFSFLFIPLSIIFLHPKILKWLINLGGKILKREVSLPELKLRSIIFIYLLYFLSWFIHATGFFFLVRSIYPVPFRSFLGVLGAFSFAWVFSMGIIFLPGGFGVREGVLAFLLKLFLPLPIASLMSLLARLWTTLGELVILLVAILLRGDYGKERKEERS